MKRKFKEGDTITAIQKGSGVEKATILSINSKYYVCKIMNGKALIPVISENNYKLL